MNNWLNNMGRRLAHFMVGRYGSDEFNQALLIAAIILTVLGYFPYLGVCSLLAWAAIIFSIYRTLSRNHSRRYQERMWYLKWSEKPRKFFNLQKNRWRDRNTHCYFTCAHCHGTLRVPKGKGKIRITCPHCKTQFSKKT